MRGSSMPFTPTSRKRKEWAGCRRLLWLPGVGQPLGKHVSNWCPCLLFVTPTRQLSFFLFFSFKNVEYGMPNAVVPWLGWERLDRAAENYSSCSKGHMQPWAPFSLRLLASALFAMKWPLVRIQPHRFLCRSEWDTVGNSALGASWEGACWERWLCSDNRHARRHKQAAWVSPVGHGFISQLGFLSCFSDSLAYTIAFSFWKLTFYSTGADRWREGTMRQLRI